MQVHSVNGAADQQKRLLEALMKILFATLDNQWAELYSKQRQGAGVQYSPMMPAFFRSFFFDRIFIACNKNTVGCHYGTKHSTVAAHILSFFNVYSVPPNKSSHDSLVSHTSH